MLVFFYYFDFVQKIFIWYYFSLSMVFMVFLLVFDLCFQVIGMFIYCYMFYIEVKLFFVGLLVLVINMVFFLENCKFFSCQDVDILLVMVLEFLGKFKVLVLRVEQGEWEVFMFEFVFFF